MLTRKTSSEKSTGPSYPNIKTHCTTPREPLPAETLSFTTYTRTAPHRKAHWVHLFHLSWGSGRGNSQNSKGASESCWTSKFLMLVTVCARDLEVPSLAGPKSRLRVFRVPAQMYWIKSSTNRVWAFLSQDFWSRCTWENPAEALDL